LRIVRGYGKRVKEVEERSENVRKDIGIWKDDGWFGGLGYGWFLSSTGRGRSFEPVGSQGLDDCAFVLSVGYWRRSGVRGVASFVHEL
jgi:hypothetical protein